MAVLEDEVSVCKNYDNLRAEVGLAKELMTSLEAQLANIRMRLIGLKISMTKEERVHAAKLQALVEACTRLQDSVSQFPAS